MPILKAQANVLITGEMVSLDRGEKAQDSDRSALSVISERFGFPVKSIVTMADVVEVLYNKPVNGKVLIDEARKEAIDAYYEEYGAKE